MGNTGPPHISTKAYEGPSSSGTSSSTPAPANQSRTDQNLSYSSFPVTLLGGSVVHLPTALVARYRAVDREIVGSALVDTPRHLDALTVDIGRRGILTPLRLGFNEEFGTLDGNHRIAVGIRLGLETVPVTRRPKNRHRHASRTSEG
jgi:hypothetical protein